MTNEEALSKANRIITDLMSALGNIERADNLHYAHGAASFALEKAKGQMVRNLHGYLAVVANGRKS